MTGATKSTPTCSNGPKTTRRPGSPFTSPNCRQGDDPPGYLVVLQPRIDRSVGRFKAAFPAGLLEGVPVEVVYSPLYFVATGTSYRDLKDRIGGSSLLGLVAARDFRPDRPEVLDPQRVLPLGPFPVRDISELGGAEAFLQRASEATVGNERA